MNKKTIITILLALVAMAAQAQEPFFRTDSAFIIGKVNGIAPQAMPKQIIVAWNNALTNNMRDKTVDVSADGDFTCRMQLHHPVLSNLVISENNMVPFYLVPGETLHMELKQDADGNWTCNYGDGSAAKKVERLLKANLDFTNEYRMMMADKSDLNVTRHYATVSFVQRSGTLRRWPMSGSSLPMSDNWLKRWPQARFAKASCSGMVNYAVQI